MNRLDKCWKSLSPVSGKDRATVTGQPDVVIIGHILNETIQFPDRVIAPVLGSPAAYSSVIATVLGAQVGLVTKIGADMPEQLLIPFREAGVDIRGVLKGEHSTRNLLIYDETGHKQVRYVQKAPDIRYDDIPQFYRAASLMFVCPMDYEVPLSTVRDLRKLEGQIVVDLGGYGGATSATHPDQKPPPMLLELAELVDVLKGSIEDCRHLFEPGQSEVDIARSFVNWGARVGIVTLGERGVLAVTAEHEYQTPAFPSQVVDVTGAGDAFSAGFLVEYLWTGEVAQAARFGCATASLVIEGTGGVQVKRMPTGNQVRTRLQSSAAEVS
jgi:sugar/nucleoside kinase (ribokinase family)